MSIKYLLYMLLMAVFFSCRDREFSVVETNKKPTNRHECAAAVINDAMYLLGGRDNRPVNRYNFTNNSWDSVGNAPLQFHHFQAVTYNNEIYIAGAFVGKYPHEIPVPEIYAYNPATNSWRVETIIPGNRQRGAAGCVVYDNKLYLAGGITDGHYDGHVKWFDEYDFTSKLWKQLNDAPHARDHFQAVVVKDKLFVAGGRRTKAKTNEVFNLTVPEVDVFDFENNTWKTFDSKNNIPTPRAGCTAIGLYNSFVVIGGESDKQPQAHQQAEIFDLGKNKWENRIMLRQGRHGTQAVLYNEKIFIAAGSANRGGGPELNDAESFDLKNMPEK